MPSRVTRTRATWLAEAALRKCYVDVSEMFSMLIFFQRGLWRTEPALCTDISAICLRDLTLKPPGSFQVYTSTGGVTALPVPTAQNSSLPGTLPPGTSCIMWKRMLMCFACRTMAVPGLSPVRRTPTCPRMKMLIRASIGNRRMAAGCSSTRTSIRPTCRWSCVSTSAQRSDTRLPVVNSVTSAVSAFS